MGEFTGRTPTPLDYSTSGQSSVAYNSNLSGASISGTSSIHLPQKKAPFAGRRHFIEVKGLKRVQQYSIKEKSGKILK